MKIEIELPDELVTIIEKSLKLYELDPCSYIQEKAQAITISFFEGMEANGVLQIDEYCLCDDKAEARRIARKVITAERQAGNDQDPKLYYSHRRLSYVERGEEVTDTFYELAFSSSEEVPS